MPPLDLTAPLRPLEFLVVDTETNGRPGEECECTEVGAVLVGGGELHDRWETLLAVRRPLTRSIQRFTQITQAMVDEAPAGEAVLGDLARLLDGRVMVAHSASFDTRVLRQAFARAGLAWPDPPVLCTVALARRLAPLARQRKLAPLAESLGIDVGETHRALADAETCARVFCALFARLCAHATTLGEALALLGPSRPSRPRRGATVRTDGGRRLGGVRRRMPDVSSLPDAPGVYIVRNDAGQPLYVGKSVRLRARARAHFAASADEGDWTAHAEIVDHVATRSELGALLTEHRLIRELRPPGNLRHKQPDRYVFLRCRLDIAYPILEVAPEPAEGRAVNVGPLRGRQSALELVEQLNSLFGLRHCGRGLPRRAWPSAYGQMGRCLSPCLGDLDPNAYRRRLDEALGLFAQEGPGARALLDHVDTQMRAAAAEQAYERAAWLRRRRARLAELLARLGPALDAAHARPRLLVAHAPRGPGVDLVWLAGGRVAAWGPLEDLDAAWQTTCRVVGDSRSDPRRPAHLTADEVAAARIAATWADGQGAPELALRPAPSRAALERFLVRASGAALAA